VAATPPPPPAEEATEARKDEEERVESKRVPLVEERTRAPIVD
jgi:hypothetical protein